MTERQEEKIYIKIIGYSGYSGWGGFARVGSLALAYLRGTDGGSFAILCYIGFFAIYIMCGVFGEGLPLHA